MKVLANGAWDGSISDLQKEHVFDDALCDGIINMLSTDEVKTVVDMGCGLGDYVKNFKEKFECEGFDGNPQTHKLTNGLCNVLDLSKPVKFPVKYDWVISLEVGEHIPKKYEDNFISNLCNSSSKGLILSWAIPGQGGRGHVNEQKNNYIIQQMLFKGFIYLPEKSQFLRDSSKLWWFKNTIMVFKKNC